MYRYLYINHFSNTFRKLFILANKKTHLMPFFSRLYRCEIRVSVVFLFYIRVYPFPFIIKSDEHFYVYGTYL